MTIGRELEALLRQRRPRDVPAQSLDPSTITAVDHRPRVNVDASNIGERLVGRRDFAYRMHELASLLTGLVPQELAVADRGAVARRQRGLVLAELVRSIVELGQVSTELLTAPMKAASTSAHSRRS